MSSDVRSSAALPDVVHSVMSLHKRGELRTGSGHPVKSRRQAIAIALAVQGKRERDGSHSADASGDDRAAAADAAPAITRTQSIKNSLAALAEIDPVLSAKVRPAKLGQLALFHELAPGSVDHDWHFLGQEQKPPHAKISCCLRCGSTMQTVRRFERDLVTYATKGEPLFSRLRPACVSSGAG